MSYQHTTFRKLFISASTACSLLVAPVFVGTALDLHGNVFGSAAAQESGHQGSGGSGQGSHGQGGQGGQSGQGGSSEQGHKGGGGQATHDVLSGEEEDSDRPAWAGGNKEANPHRGTGNATPGTNKGDLYGDLWVYIRDPITGEPITVSHDEVDACTDTCYEVVVCASADCAATEVYYLSTAPDAELPAGVTPLEVDFGRLNVGRAPTKVIQHSEDEAISKVTADGAVLTLDPAGRIVVDGATIDSPLENLALYIAILKGDQQVLTALQPLLEKESISALNLAASLLGAAADKTGDIAPAIGEYTSNDMVWYLNLIYGVSTATQPYDYSTFTYDRSEYNTTVSYYYMDGDAVKQATVNLKDFLDATQPLSVTEPGITLFSIAADDAVEVVELLHTQIHPAELPGTVTP